ncbi:MAG: ABC transporter substrate-binding protein [Crocosphaera sp.]
MNNNKNLKIILAAVGTISILAIIILIWEFALKPIILTKENTNTDSNSITIDNTKNSIENSLEQRLSSGDRRLFTNQNNPSADQGIEAFVAGNYEQAYQQFNEAVKAAPNDPEVQIYLNNSQARKAGKPFVLAAVVPVDQKRTNAEEMLRGVAQAQSQFNQQGVNGRLLEIVIVNDSNDPNYAQQVAQKIVNNNDILGVIGHNSSSASAKGLEEYEKAGIAMISSTSTSTSLSGNVFFRTVPSDAKAGQFLAQYSLDNTISSVAVFYTSTSSYSDSLKQAFIDKFQILGTVKKIDISISNFDPKSTVESLQDQVDAFVLFPNTDNKIINLALQVADANANLTNPKKLLGGDALYNPATLKLSQGGVDGLVLAVPWFAKNTYPYTNLAAKRWGGRVSWRTATSYDVTKAFIKALSENATRNSVLTNLQTTNLSPSETSGEPLQFLKSGDRNTDPLLVRVIRKSSNFAEYDFEIIND